MAMKSNYSHRFGKKALPMLKKKKRRKKKK